MTRIGYTLSSEEWPPAELARLAARAEESGYVHQIGPDQEGFFRFCASEVLPALAGQPA